MLDGPTTWARQAPLADRWRLSIPDRPGFGRTPIEGRTDWEREGGTLAGALSEPAHLIGHSYGTMVAMVAAARRPDHVLSLTLIEPPAFSLLPDDADAVQFMASVEEARFAHRDDPRSALATFAQLMGLPGPSPDDLPSAVETGVRLFLDERLPWEGQPPVDSLRTAAFPILVVSCTESPLRMRAARALADAVGAEWQTLEGGHNLQRRGAPFNDTWDRFARRA
jgi:pimeloyl-ACP methyl ester carboxylesterase